MAQMYGQHGDQEHCRFYLSKANEEGYPIKDALRDNEFAGLRTKPEFVAFVRSLKPRLQATTDGRKIEVVVRFTGCAPNRFV